MSTPDATPVNCGQEQTLTVSVVIPTYNYGRFLGAAIESALGQSYPPLEIIVVDDGSTDDTPDVAARYAGKIRYVRKENAGVSAARNTGVAHATGDLVAFLDADDRWLPEKLARQVPLFADAAVGLVHAGSRIFDHDTGGILCELLPEESTDFHAALRWCCISAPSTVIRRRIFDEAGPFDQTIVEGEDWDMWIRIAAAGYKLTGCRHVLVEYRTHASNTSRANPYRHYAHCLKVLNKHAGDHPGCADCRRVLREARKQAREIYYDKASAIARERFRAGKWAQGAAWRLRSVWHYPGILLRAPEILQRRMRGGPAREPQTSQS